MTGSSANVPLYRPMPVLIWTTIGPLVCTLISLGYTMATFRTLGQPAYNQALINAILLPLALSIPLFLFVSVKLCELAEANETLGRMAATDELTSCLNRAAFIALIEDELVRDTARHHYGAFLVLDVDNFKYVNDRFGHHVGDHALTLIAQTLRKAVRRGDMVGRLGGEEFGIFLPGIDLQSARIVAERVRQAIAEAEFNPDGERYTLTISVGGIMCDNRARFEDLFARADRHLYAAKKAGRNRVTFADPMNISEHTQHQSALPPSG